MPELPEVEVTRLGIAGRITGARIVSLELGKPLRWALGIDAGTLAGRTVQGLRRWGKYLLFDLDEGLLLLHLGMSGSLRLGTDLPPPGKHDHFDLLTSRGLLRLTDPRRFGAVVYASHEDEPPAAKLLGRLGMEPLDESFGAEEFYQQLHRRHAPIKQVLLAGEVVVGVGNIYASEVLFAAGIRPMLAAARISRPRAVRLHAAVREILTRAVARGGSTLRDFSNADGEHGLFQLEARVYGRSGQPCHVCGSPIRQVRQGQRSTFFCPLCQK